MRGLEKNRMKRDRHHTDRHTYNGHRDSMIESAQWADSMKIDAEEKKREGAYGEMRGQVEQLIHKLFFPLKNE